MPRIEIQDAWGTMYRIDSHNAGTIMAWLFEWASKLVSSDISHQPAIRMTIWPLYNPNGTPDWDRQEAQDHFITLSHKKLSQLKDYIEKLNAEGNGYAPTETIPKTK